MITYNFQKLEILRNLCDLGGNTLAAFAVKWVHAMTARGKRKEPNDNLQLPEIINSKKPLRPLAKYPCVLCGKMGSRNERKG